MNILKTVQIGKEVQGIVVSVGELCQIDQQCSHTAHTKFR